MKPILPYVFRGAPLALGLLVLVVIARAGSSANPGPIGFPLDDAWIHLVYGRGMTESGFLAYEDGVPTTGATSPVWATVLAAVHVAVPAAAGVDGIVRAVGAIGILLHLAVIALATSLARRLARSDAVGAAAGALVALATPFAAAAFSGMEVGLAALLLLAGVRDAANGAWGRAGLWLALAGGTRPESGAVIVLLALVAALRPTEAGPPERARPTPTGKDQLPRLAPVARFLIAPVVGGLAFFAYDLWASGAPLPSAFYAKSSLEAAALPARLGQAVTGILSQVPPLGTGVAWIALAGWLPGVGRPTAAGKRGAGLPALAAAVYVLANVALIDPVDPPAFYHVRYLLPAVPLLLVALALGATRLGGRLRRRHLVPLVVLVGLGLVDAGRTALPVSRHLHNDIRNINEVQRRIGEHLREVLPPGTRIATSDAGAVRYFSGLPTIDVTGLNTPAMRDASDEFLRTHAARALVLLPAWYRTLDAPLLEETFRARTDRYTVTSSPQMATQIVLRLRASDGAPQRVRFIGFRSFALEMVP